MLRDMDTAKETEPSTAPESSKSAKASTQETKTAETSKKATPESKSSATKTAAKAKKAPEPVDATDEPPTKRITRAQLKECNIVLEKLSPDASVESLTLAEKKETKAKRRSGGGDAATKPASAKKMKQDVIKNTNPEIHSLTKLDECPMCDKPAKLSMVNHYVNSHPDSEVAVSRLAPDVADALRDIKVAKVAKKFTKSGKNYSVFEHHCHFCNVTKSMTRVFWINHMAKHTGYYQYKCNDCPRSFAEKSTTHACKGRNNCSKIPQPHFLNDTIKGYICDLCNFVRFTQKDIEKHLQREHESNDLEQFQEVVFLNFPKRQRKGHLDADNDEEYEEEEIVFDSPDDESVDDSTPKRRKTTIADPVTPDKQPPEKVLRSRVVHAEAFISEPKEDDGLFDKDTMKLMKDMSFSASKDGECTVRSNRAKSIAEKLSERFNSVQENDSKAEKEVKKAKAEPLDPMTCDEDIPIIRVAATDECTAAERTAEASAKTEASVVSVVEKTSPASIKISSPRNDNCTPTEELAEESDDDNWESYSSDSENDSASVDVADEAKEIQSETNNRKNVGIIDTIARLQQSISSAATGESQQTQQQVSPDTSTTANQSPEENTINAVMDDAIADNPVTYEAIVSETIQKEAADKPKECVSNGRTPGGGGGNYSFNFSGTFQSTSSHLGSYGLGGSSSNADSTNNDVDMLDVNRPAKILTRIDNIGYTRYTADGSVTFCCLIDDCGFESMDLTNLLYHINDHPSIQWFGYCFTCNAQIETECMQLMMEFKHMTSAHYNQSDDNEDLDKSNAMGRPSFIKCKALPGDKLSKLKEEEEIAAKRMPSSSSSAAAAAAIAAPAPINKIKINFLKNSDGKSVTSDAKSVSADATKMVPMIAEVVSLGHASKDYSEMEPVSLKPWGARPTNKVQRNCRKMLRDICLYALFKCMDVNCAYTTDNADHMLTHLRNHENVPSEPTWLECPYCDIMADSCSLLVKHVQDEHQSSIFQCPYCFYRSCSAFNVVIHLKQFHASDKKSVLVCNGKPRMYATEKALIEKSRRENIRPLRCTEGKAKIARPSALSSQECHFGTPSLLSLHDPSAKQQQKVLSTCPTHCLISSPDCTKITYVMDHFVSHMKNSTAHGDAFKCQFCGFNTPITETSKHLLIHSVGVYECVYCHYGINDVDSIQSHMCNTHPSKLLYICVRLTQKDRDLVSINSNDGFDVLKNSFSLFRSPVRRTIGIRRINVDRSSGPNG